MIYLERFHLKILPSFSKDTLKEVYCNFWEKYKQLRQTPKYSMFVYRLVHKGR